MENCSMATNKKRTYFETEIVWNSVLIMLFLHLSGLFGFYQLYVHFTVAQIILWYGWAFASSMGIIAGAHRLWSHRCYKAKAPLKILFVVLCSMTFQNSIYDWVRDHRVHHKFVDTNADPYNIQRGIFFAHCGWLMLKKHPDVKQKGKSVDLSDLNQDPYVMFQKRHYFKLMLLLTFFLPAYLHWRLGAPLFASVFLSISKYIFAVNLTWLINSAAHCYGMKPFDKSIKPTDNKFTAFLTLGEGWHNYHHVFPWDYKAEELGLYFTNPATLFIDICSKLGLAYDKKTVSSELIRRRVQRTGDGSHLYGLRNDFDDINIDNKLIWGWNDPDLSDIDKNIATSYN